MRYVSVGEVTAINAAILAGTARVRDVNMLESAVMRPRASAFGSDAYPTVVDKGAALFHSLILNHPFVDGNKRTAVITLVVFLNLNGLAEAWEEDDAYDFTISVARGERTVADVRDWIAARVRARE
ncbi:MAG: type II toxin-antitoxin system death-on-curing family toxin [Chloroflexi bacterium]|nr:type II toxin-antitoxin system death-on-curing family toxin [Chloroflexota bacterium]